MHQDFSDKYFSDRQTDSSRRSKMHELDLKFVNARINLPNDAKILDFGCSDGAFVSLLQNGDRQLFGIEISSDMCELAGSKGIEMIENINECGGVDLVIFRGVLQHTSNQVSLLDAAIEVTRERLGTIAILQTPNSDAYLFRRFRRLPALEEDLSFTSIFLVPSASALELYFARRGLNVVTSYPYLETPYARPFLDFSKILYSMLTKKYVRVAFPKNMFNLLVSHDQVSR